ncbi:hypothetical protein ASF48_05040 [Rathayibacter sp. Leaf299]|uniref:hypothetical protein n=1 Tax=Rathayibacter sp. Leaf299 TaxID=1736328 RepID=UPI0006F7378C|nr:hypothetical protein [Rathayibacter sp. Leaf299]KQQ22552.1 hypothetical protein ASF48_05040 [Rathayibacter sp. Leaf299]
MTTPADFLVKRDGRVYSRSTGKSIGLVYRIRQLWSGEPMAGDVLLQGRTRSDVLRMLAEHLAPPFPPIGSRVTRTTTRGGKHTVTVHWVGQVTHHLKTKVRVRWDTQNGRRTVAVLDHYPHEIQEQP